MNNSTSKISAKKQDEQITEIVIDMIQNRSNTKKAITSDRLITRVRRKSGIEIGGPRLRKVINNIRVKKLIPNLVAGPKGYFIENDTKQVRKYIKSLKERAEAILQVANSLEKGLKGRKPKN